MPPNLKFGTNLTLGGGLINLLSAVYVIKQQIALFLIITHQGETALVAFPVFFLSVFLSFTVFFSSFVLVMELRIILVLLKIYKDLFLVKFINNFKG